MIANELIEKLNKEFGLYPWPKTYEVDAETYGYCCQAIFDHLIESKMDSMFGYVRVFLGLENNGLMFKNVELILKKETQLQIAQKEEWEGRS